MSLCPDELFHRDPGCFRHFLESICPLRGLLDIADALVGELRQHNVSCHNRPPLVRSLCHLARGRRAELATMASAQPQDRSVSGYVLSCTAATLTGLRLLIRQVRLSTLAARIGFSASTTS